MKIKKILITAITIIANVVMTQAQNVNIPDTIFKAALVNSASINTNMDTEIQITEAAAVLVLCTLTTLNSTYLNAHIDLTRDTRSMQEEQIQGFRAHLHTAVATKPDHEIRLWNDKQAYIALGQLLTACALLKLDATPMEGFDPNALDELLALEEKGLHSVLICTIGKRSENDRYQHLKKVRRPIKSLFTTR